MPLPHIAAGRIGALIALAALPFPAAAQQSGPAPGGQDIRGDVPEAFSKYSEYNMPADLYIPGDPILLEADTEVSGKRISFVACPILRDSEPTPLWHAEYNGKLYFLRTQQNMSGRVHHPQLRHKVLVEGVVSDEPKIGGGIVLNPLHISVLRELDPSCNRIIPSEGYKIAFAKRPPGPGSSGAGREAKNAARAAARARMDAEPYVRDQVPQETRTFVVPFNYDSDVVWHYSVVNRAAKFAKDVDAARVEVRGTHGSALLSDGRVISEFEGAERQRVENVVAILTDYHVAPALIDARWDSTPMPADGIHDVGNRVVTITVIPHANDHGRQTAGK